MVLIESGMVLIALVLSFVTTRLALPCFSSVNRFFAVALIVLAILRLKGAQEWLTIGQ